MFGSRISRSLLEWTNHIFVFGSCSTTLAVLLFSILLFVSFFLSCLFVFRFFVVVFCFVFCLLVVVVVVVVGGWVVCLFVFSRQLRPVNLSLCL